jgi:hypothetical protein
LTAWHPRRLAQHEAGISLRAGDGRTQFSLTADGGSGSELGGQQASDAESDGAGGHQYQDGVDTPEIPEEFL